MRFEKSVRVATGPAGNVTLNVADAAGAGRFLLEEWPGKPGRKHLAARKAVLAALENAHDHVLAERARKAFVAAAQEADIFRGDPPKSDVPPEFKTPSWRKR